MTVRPLDALGVRRVETPDVPLPDAASSAANDSSSFAGSLAKAFTGAADSLDRAAKAERAFASGRGGLQEMILERAQADVALSIASAAASRTAQSLSTILGMQV